MPSRIRPTVLCACEARETRQRLPGGIAGPEEPFEGQVLIQHDPHDASTRVLSERSVNRLRLGPRIPHQRLELHVPDHPTQRHAPRHSPRHGPPALAPARPGIPATHRYRRYSPRNTCSTDFPGDSSCGTAAVGQDINSFPGVSSQERPVQMETQVLGPSIPLSALPILQSLMIHGTTLDCPAPAREVDVEARL